MATSLRLQKIGRILLILTASTLGAPGLAQSPSSSPEEHDLNWTVRDWTLHGTYTAPPSPLRGAVLLIAGSGPTDRNWEGPAIPGTNGSGRLLADLLAAQGYASLRYDKLGSGETGVPESYLEPDFTFGKVDYMAGLQGALNALRDAAGNEVPTFLAGHSEGGLWALELARQNPELQGTVLLATAGRSQCDLVVEQLEAQLKGFELSEAKQESEIQSLQAALDHVATEGAAPSKELLPELPGLQAVVSAYANPQTIELTKWLCGTDPVSLLPEDGQNLLILQGGYDQQVDADKDGQLLHLGSPGSVLVVAPQADHVLKRLELEGQPLNMLHALKYNQEGRVLDPLLTDALLQWLAARANPESTTR